MPDDPSYAFVGLDAVGAALLTILVIVASAGLGFLAGRRQRRKRGEGEPPVGSIVGAALGLLAFLLAFTFGMAASRHDARRRLVLEHANAIGTADLRSTLVSNETGERVHALLAEYVDLLLSVARDPSHLATALIRTGEIEDQLWSTARDALRADPTSQAAALFTAALNDVFDLQSDRLQVGARDRIPAPIWIALYFLTALCMLAVGYHAGMMGSARLLPLTVLVLAFSTVVLLIADLDRPQQGFLRVSQEPLEDVARELGAGRD